MSRLFITLLGILLVTILCGCNAHPNAEAHALLQDYQDIFVPGGSTKKVFAALDDLEARAKALQEPVPDGFLLRYKHVLSTTRTIMTSEEGNDLPHETISFLESITGKAIKNDRDLIPNAADALTEEVRRLEVLLDKG